MVMTVDVQSAISSLVRASKPVLNILEVDGRMWFRKPKDGRRGPWLSVRYDVVDQRLWDRRGPCIYFVSDGQGVLRYVGISLNKLGDRWRTSPAFTELDERLLGEELFHSQCWHKIAHPEEREDPPFVVSVLSGREALSVLASIEHEISALSVLRDDPEIIVTVLELWICKYGYTTLWNKALTGGNQPRPERAFE